MEKKKQISYNNNFFHFAGKLADICLLSMAWVIFCLPIITIVPSTAALYYAVAKTVRKNHGSALKEFWCSFRTNLKQGMYISLIMLPLALLIIVNIYAVEMFTTNETLQVSYALLSRTILVLGVFSLRYLFAILSRFKYKAIEYIKVSFIMALRHFLTTLLLTISLIVIVEVVYVLPFLIVIAPGIVVYLDSFLIERIFQKYMSRPTEGEKIPWYWFEKEV